MKEITKLNIARLTQLEFGQHLKRMCESIDSLGEGFITDAIFSAYLENLKQHSLEYDEAMVQIMKSNETAKIVSADKQRNTALFSIKRMLKVFEFSEWGDERDSFASLNTLFKAYKNIHHWNYEEKTNGIDNLVNDLSEPKYSAQINRLSMQAYVLRLQATNSIFNNAFSNRTHEAASKKVYDVKAMRREAKEVYDNLIQYVLAMAKVQDSDEFDKPLSIINTVRKYYSDLLAKRVALSKEKPKPMDITISAN